MKWLSVFALFLALVAAENPEGRLICIYCVGLAYILTRTNVSLFVFLRNHTKFRFHRNFADCIKGKEEQYFFSHFYILKI